MNAGDETTARDLLARAHALLLDFDGPVCAVFSGFPAPVVADQLRTILADGGHHNLPHDIATVTDPFEILRYAAILGADEARYVEAAFTAHEVEAIVTAEPTPGAHDLMAAWHESGRALAIVSNNSTQSIEAYLDFYELRSLADYVSARTSPDPELLKPNPSLLRQAVNHLRRPSTECVYLGDSTTDIDAAHAIDMPAIGYANKPDKEIKLTGAGADAIITKLAQLVAVR
ncbi:HAD family hydrolase [Amycolatopsis nigrescens]|uniref:HAD family hydrolase n=1 Tax=Amycolatopsis nigrescens TaxID=381445 RepID=UPI000362A730|nr:HAD-IA family hydrolase [Amycolatopsis nigrescens]